MVELKRDRKAAMWNITTTDGEGFHRQLAVSDKDMKEIVRIFNILATI
jgi:hypothetical protein